MAMQPTKPPPKPNPLHGASPASQQERVTMPGLPPQPHMTPHNQPVGFISDSTNAEMDAGKRALEAFRERIEAEHAAGKRIVDRHTNPRG
jgi:hypothetical protein